MTENPLFAAAGIGVQNYYSWDCQAGPPARLPRAEQRPAAADSEDVPSILLELAMVLRASLRGAAACLHANCLPPSPRIVSVWHSSALMMTKYVSPAWCTSLSALWAPIFWLEAHRSFVLCFAQPLWALICFWPAVSIEDNVARRSRAA